MNDSGPSIYNRPNQSDPYSNYENTGANVKTMNMAKIFGYMSLGLLVTGVASTLFAILFSYLISINPDSIMGIYVGTFFVSIGTLVCTIFAGSLSFTSQRKPTSHSVAIPFGIYAVLIGYLFGLIFLVCPWEVLAITFGCTAGLFGILALIGGFAKRNMSMMAYIGSALIGGAFLLSFVNMMLMWFAPEVYMPIYWVISFAIFAGLMFSTIYDVWQIKTISAHYENTPNLNLFCAFRLYCDFIALFIRLLYFILVVYSRNSNN